jgi:hypothetical protein
VVFNGTNQCPFTITVCYTESGGVSFSGFAAPGGSFFVNVSGSEASLASAVMWGYPGNLSDISDCNSTKLQANLAEFSINGSSNTDSYYISNVVCPSGPPASLPFPASFRMLSRLKKKKTHVMHHEHKTFPSDSFAISNLNLR